MRSIIFAAALLLLVSSVALAAPAPDNYCTTVSVEAVTAGYDVTATGSGRYARIRDLTASTTVVATDFGVGATAYAWTGVTLDVTHEYQVQVSHTSLTTGFSTSGCKFTPPPPLGVIFGDFTATVEGQVVTLDWDTFTEYSHVGFNVHRAQDEAAPKEFLAFVPSPAPGGMNGAEYQYSDTPGPGSWLYWVEDVDITGSTHMHGPVSATVQSPTSVSLASFVAYGTACHWERRPRLRCECGDNKYSPWAYCLQRR